MDKRNRIVKLAAVTSSGVVVGGRGGMLFPQRLSRGNGVPPKLAGFRGNGDARAFPQRSIPATFFAWTARGGCNREEVRK